MSDRQFLLIKDGAVVDPDRCLESERGNDLNRVKEEILIAGEKIAARQQQINCRQLPELQIISGEGKLILPGFIDSHVHITGGGGENGFSTRTPPLSLEQAVRGGVTTLVGCLGTDASTRTMSNLLAKARGLQEEGITAYIYTGSYQFPVKTLTGAIDDDLVFIKEILGLGEVAIADHRSSHPSLQEFIRAASHARRGGMLAGKRGIVNIHMGGGKDGFEFLEEAVATSEIPRQQFLPTHVNRSEQVLEKGLKYARKGGWLDFTTSGDNSADAKINGQEIMQAASQAGVSLDNLTFSSDAQGSLPEFDEEGNFQGLKIGEIDSLFSQVRDIALNTEIKLTRALTLITINPAKILGISGTKGYIKPGFDADVVMVDENTLEITDVIARGEVMMREGEILQKGTFG